MPPLDELLTRVRDAAETFAAAPARSDAESEASADLTAAFRALDEGLRAGGEPPADWPYGAAALDQARHEGFEKGWAARGLAARRSTRPGPPSDGPDSPPHERCNCAQAGTWGTTGVMPPNHHWHWLNVQHTVGYLAHGGPGSEAQAAT